MDAISILPPDDAAVTRLAAALSMHFSTETFRFLQRALPERVNCQRNVVIRPQYIVPVFKWHRVVFAIQDTYQLPIHADVFDDLIPRLQCCLQRVFTIMGPTGIRKLVETLTTKEQPIEPSTIAESDVDKLEDDIALCWREFRNRASPQSVPVISIVLPSAFNRCTLLYELAKRAIKSDVTDPSYATSDARHMRLLYVGVRDKQHPASTRFPLATPCLQAYLFPNPFPTRGDVDKRALTARLCRLFQYCWTQWRVCGEQWLALFRDPSADRTVSASLERAAAEFRQTNEPRPHGPLLSDRYIERRVLVLALAEARSLTVSFESIGIECWLVVLRRALKRANRTIAKRFGKYAGVLVVATDGSPEIVHCLLPPEERFLCELQASAS